MPWDSLSLCRGLCFIQMSNWKVGWGTLWSPCADILWFLSLLTDCDTNLEHNWRKSIERREVQGPSGPGQHVCRWRGPQDEMVSPWGWGPSVPERCLPLTRLLTLHRHEGERRWGFIPTPLTPPLWHDYHLKLAAWRHREQTFGHGRSGGGGEGEGGMNGESSTETYALQYVK